MDCQDKKREPFLSKSIKKSHQKSFPKTITSKHGIVCQRGAKMVPKSIPKSIKINAQIGNQKIIKVIKIHVFLNGKIIQIHCKNNGSEGFTGCARERKRYQINIRNDTTNHTNID